MIPVHARTGSAPLLLAVALALATGGALAQEDISKVNGGVSAESGQTYRDLSTVNGGIRIGDGVRLRNAETVNGGIRGGDGLQAEDMETVNGGINLGARAQVETLTTVNGGVRLGTDARVGRHSRASAVACSSIAAAMWAATSAPSTARSGSSAPKSPAM